MSRHSTTSASALSSSGQASYRSSSTKVRKSDWFGATWIRWAFFFLLTSFALFVWHSWRKHEPMVDLKLLKNRNYGVGCLLIFFFGIAIYSTIVVLPLFYQELLGYTAFTAGMVVAPRGLGTICGLPAIGYLSNKVDPRYLLTCGFTIFGLTVLYFGNATLDISPTTLLLPILITGFGLSFVFVPLNIAAYGTLRAQQIGNASGLFNLTRNIGGSIGISIAQTILTRHTAAHQNEIVNSVPLTGQRLPEFALRNPPRAHQLLRPSQHPSSRPVPPLQRTPSPGSPVGLRRRLPLALSAQLPLPRHLLALQESRARPSSPRRPLGVYLP